MPNIDKTWKISHQDFKKVVHLVNIYFKNVELKEKLKIVKNEEILGCAKIRGARTGLGARKLEGREMKTSWVREN